jgi:hypothetical protein
MGPNWHYSHWHHDSGLGLGAAFFNMMIDDQLT